MKVLAFGSRREEHNRLKQLQEGKIPMTIPQQRNMHNAIKTIAQDATKRDAEYLLDIASNNQYGIKKNSALRQYMNEKSSISGMKLENNDWHTVLEAAIAKAAEKLPKTAQEKFQAKYNRLLVEQQGLTQEEKKLIKYRESILKNPEMQRILNSKKTGYRNMASNAVRNMDFFIASSEVPMQEKIYVLSKLDYMLSDKYEINKQIKDKKVQVFSEVINDLVIKTPMKEIRNTKECSQEYHGSCAAISIARKALVYEDKKAYIDLILNELSSSPYLEIYDVTNILKYADNKSKYENERAPKIKVPKNNINFNRALFEGYRIIDASVLYWMHVAGSIGDGTLQLEHYYAFDNRRKGLMRDNRVVNSLSKDYASSHDLLRFYIKANESLEKYEKNQIKKKIKEKDFASDSMLHMRKRDLARKELMLILSSIAPEKSSTELFEIIKQTKHRQNINIKNNETVLSAQVNQYFTSKLGTKYKEALLKESQKIISTLRNYLEANKAVDGLSNTMVDKYNEVRELYDIALAYHYIVKETAGNPNYRDGLYDALKMPDRATQVKNEVRRLKKLLKTNPDSEYIIKLKSKFPVDDIEKMLTDMDKSLTTKLPKEIDNLLSFYGLSYRAILLDMVNTDLESTQNGDFAALDEVSTCLNKDFTQKQFIKLLEKVKTNLENAENNDELNAAMAELGSHNQYELIKNILEKISKNILYLVQKGDVEQLKKLYPEYNKFDNIIDFATKVDEINNKILKM